MTTSKETYRSRNPFYNPLVAERIRDPKLYRKLFSPKVLVGETLEVFQPVNVVLLGPQGSGKSMILNMIRLPVVAEWLSKHNTMPEPLSSIPPYFGLCVNLVLCNFHAFGRRSISRAAKGGDHDPGVELSCAADFMNHMCLKEFLRGLELVIEGRSPRLRSWLGFQKRLHPKDEVASTIAKWKCWFGYYRKCTSFQKLKAKVEERLATWFSFINANTDDIPDEVWTTKATLGEPVKEMGKLVNTLSTHDDIVPLFIVIDQYEVLPELNPVYGTGLQRVVNSLLKTRDPLVSYKIGARTHDWGKELRIWGAESRIEVQRDYVVVNLCDSLMRNEDAQGWVFPDFANDVIDKRLRVEGGFPGVLPGHAEKMFGKWNEYEEANIYFRRHKANKMKVLRGLQPPAKSVIAQLCGEDASALDLRLAAAWCMQRSQRKDTLRQILSECASRPWSRDWWRKERREVALLQIASFANQRRIYYGWDTILYLSGGNITCLLDICAEVWDTATKRGEDPATKQPLPYRIQTDGVYVASEKWLNRDRSEVTGSGGAMRYQALARLGPAISDMLSGSLAISNPGHSGFSIGESDFGNSDHGKRVCQFLERGADWAVFEERAHTSKHRGDQKRRKWYLHPLLSPVFGIPFKRTKEPLYISDIDIVYGWFFTDRTIVFGNKRSSVDEPLFRSGGLP